MMSFLRLACLAALLPLPSFAAEPTTVDVYRELVRYRAATVGAENALDYNTRDFQAIFLDNPDSQYSALRADPPIGNEIWWYDFVDGLSIKGDNRTAAALEMLQWQGGFTKARPGQDVMVDAQAKRSYRGREAAANAMKAGVDADIFLKAWDMNGRMTTVGAGHALALQLLREQIKTHAPDTHEARGIKPGVLTRYLALRNPQMLSESDQRYLADLLRLALSRPGFMVDSGGRRQLPAAYRVARIAAAYADAGGYFNAAGYCQGNEPRPGEPEGGDATLYNRPLCFIAATDRAVQAWFRRQMRLEMSGVRIHENTDASSARALFWLSTVLLLIDVAGFVEIGDASVIGEMRTEGALTDEDVAFAEDRAHQLTCRIR